jgi:hypothetical protein
VSAARWRQKADGSEYRRIKDAPNVKTGEVFVWFQGSATGQYYCVDLDTWNREWEPIPDPLQKRVQDAVSATKEGRAPDERDVEAVQIHRGKIL